MASTHAEHADRDVLHALGLDRAGRRRRWLRRTIWIGAAAVVVTGAVALYLGSRATPAVVLEVRPAERVDLVVTVTASGTLEPWNTVAIGPEISGRVRAVHADYNDRVVRGQVLVELDTDLLRAQAEQAVSQVALGVATARQARATRDEARLELERTVTLAAGGIAPAAELDAARAAARRAEAALAAAEAQERSARASLTVARTNLDKATIRSPIDGVVLSRSVDAGQTVVAALQAPVLFQLAEDLGRMRLVVDVDEADIGRVSAGQAATFTVAAWPDRTFAANVAQVRNAAQTRENVVTYQAVLDVDNSDGALRPGMTATAQITAATEKDALVVPNAALRYRPRGRPEGAADGSPRVWIQRDGHEVELPVTPGPTDGTRTVVRAGELRPGDAVIVGAREPAR